MANKNNSFNFNVPVGIILLALMVNPPVGVVLAVLRFISRSYKRSNNFSDTENSFRITPRAPGSEYASGARNTRNTYNYSTDKKKNTVKKSKSAPGDAMKIISYVLFAVAALIPIGGLSVLFSGTASLGEWLAIYYPGTMAVLAAALGFLFASSSTKKRSVRYSRIRAIIGDHDSFNLTKLASASGTSLRRVRKDLQKLIDKGEFGSKAYIDLGTNNFMRHPDAEPDDIGKVDYKDGYGDLFKEKKKKDAADSTVTENLGMDSDNDDFKTIIREIRRLNDEIKDDVVSEKIYKIEAHTKNIFEYVSAHPESMPLIRTFLNYYLPTTLKLLESYSRIEKVGVAGDNMKKSKESIENTLDMLEGAFKRQIDELFKNESLDISSDISVLETMMKKDGLNGKDDFDFSKYSDKISEEIPDDLSSGGAAAKKD